MESPVTICLGLLITTVLAEAVADGISYVGCFDPGYALRLNYHHHMNEVNLRDCVNTCRHYRTRYAGVEQSDDFCYCGSDIAEESIRRNDSLCAVSCVDQASKTCGGEWVFSLYDIGAPEIGPMNVSFLLGLSIGVRLYSANEQDDYSTLMTTADWVYTVDYHYQKSLVFAFSKGKLFKSTKLPKTTVVSARPTLVKEGMSNCDGFAVDWVTDQVFYADCRNNSIMAMGLGGDGARVQVVRELPRTNIKRMEVDPYEGMLFWTADGVIEGHKLGEHVVQTNMSEEGVTVRALTLDLKARRVYYVGALNSSTSLFSVHYEGGDSTKHFSLPQMKSVYGLTLLHGVLYWVNYANVRDVVYRAPLSLNGTVGVEMIRSIDRAVWHMRAMHPDLQRQPSRDPCEDKGCQHSCTSMTSVTALCTCPEGEDLDEDGVTCLAVVRQAQPLTPTLATTSHSSLILGLVLVFAVALVALGLVYLGDRYWTSLQAKFSVPYRRADPPTPAYDTTADNVNLV